MNWIWISALIRDTSTERTQHFFFFFVDVALSSISHVSITYENNVEDFFDCSWTGRVPVAVALSTGAELITLCQEFDYGAFAGHPFDVIRAVLWKKPVTLGNASLLS